MMFTRCPNCTQLTSVANPPYTCSCGFLVVKADKIQHNTTNTTNSLLKKWVPLYFIEGKRWRSHVKDKICKSINSSELNLSTIETYRESLLGIYNRIKARRGLPGITHQDMLAISRPVKGHNQPLPLVTALSLLPNHNAVQTQCLDSWKHSGYTIHAQNTEEEIVRLQTIYPQVDCWHVCNEVSTAYNYPTQTIYNLLGLTQKLGPIILINSDIEIRSPQQILLNPDEVVLGIRWNYNQTHDDARQFKWGMDAITCTPQQHRTLPRNMPYAIGQAMWDYAVPDILRSARYKLRFIYNRMFFHKEHPQNWNKKGWYLGAEWLANHGGYDMIDMPHSEQFRAELDPTMIWSKTGHQYVSKDSNRN